MNRETLKSLAGLIGSLMASIGGVIVIAPSWDALMVPSGLGAVVLAIASSLGAWFTPTMKQ